MPNTLQLASLAVATALLLAAALPASAKVVGKPALTAACAKEAAKRLATDQSDVLTLPTELTKGTYVVNAQVMPEGGSMIMVECRFDSKKHFKNISIDGQSYKVSASAGSDAPAASTEGATKAAPAACMKQMMGAATVEQVSHLRAGYHEIILTEKQTGRRVACTVSDSGKLEDWVEMN